jgi:quinol-cytochrome oxidoreductase complex cytochrome b subunit
MYSIPRIMPSVQHLMVESHLAYFLRYAHANGAILPYRGISSYFT